MYSVSPYSHQFQKVPSCLFAYNRFTIMATKTTGNFRGSKICRINSNFVVKLAFLPNIFIFLWWTKSSMYWNQRFRYRKNILSLKNYQQTATYEKCTIKMKWRDYNFFTSRDFCRISRKYFVFPKVNARGSLKYCSLQFLQEENYFRDNRTSCDLRENENVYFREN